MEIINRKEAHKAELKYFFTGKPCKRGHMSRRYTSNGQCVKCGPVHVKNHREKNKSKTYVRKDLRGLFLNCVKLYKDFYIKMQIIKEYNTNLCLNCGDEIIIKNKNSIFCQECSEKRNLELARQYQKKYRNPEENREYVQNWRDENPEKAKETARKGQDNYKKTPSGQLRNACKDAFRRLETPKIKNSKLELLGYSPEEFSSYLLNGLNFNNLSDAKDEGYHIDHICPIKHVAKNIDDKLLAFKISMDLKNLRLITEKKNMEKRAKIDLPEVQEAIKYLNQKYNVNMPLK